MRSQNNFLSLNHTIGTTLTLLLLLSSLPAAADLPSCDAMDSDATLLSCSCTDTDGSIRPTPDLCGDMLSGQRHMIRGDDLVLSKPGQDNGNPTTFGIANNIYETKALSSDPNLGDYDNQDIRVGVNSIDCETSHVPAPQRTRVGRLYESSNDLILTLSAISGNSNSSCAPGSSGDNNLALHTQNYVTGEHNSKAAEFFANANDIQMAVDDFNYDGYDDVLVLAKNKFVIVSAPNPLHSRALETYETSASLFTSVPLNEPTTGDFNGDGLIDVFWIGGNINADDGKKGDLEIYSATVCPGDVPGDPICGGRSPFEVVGNPAAKLAPGVANARSSFSMHNDLPGDTPSASLETNTCSASLRTGRNKIPTGNVRAGAVVLGNFDQSNGLGATGQPIDELMVAYVSGFDATESDPCTVDIWYLVHHEPTSSHPSWMLADADLSALDNLPQATTLQTSASSSLGPGAKLTYNLFAKAAALDWMSGVEQAIFGVGAYTQAFDGNREQWHNLSRYVPITASPIAATGSNSDASLSLEVCVSPTPSASTPTFITASGKYHDGVRNLWGMAVGRFTPTRPADGDTACTDPDATGVCPYNLQIATHSAELDGTTGSSSRMTLWSLESTDSGKQCANDSGIETPFVPVQKTHHSLASSTKLVGGFDRAGSMLRVGDLRGNSIRLGQPTIERVSSHTQPIAILQAPPSHIDYQIPNQESTSTLLNISAVNEELATSYKDETSDSEGASHQTTSSWGYSFEQSLSQKVVDNALTAVPGVTSVTLADKQTFSEGFGGTQNKSIGQDITQTFSLDTKTAFQDIVRYTQTEMNIFHYPIIGSQTCPSEIVCSAADPTNITCGGDIDPQTAIVLNLLESQSYPQGPHTDCKYLPGSGNPGCPDPTGETAVCNMGNNGNACCSRLTGPLNYVLSGPQQTTVIQSPGNTLEWYQPPHGAGQAFSYPASTKLARARLGRTQGTSTPEADILAQAISFTTGNENETIGTQWDCKSVSDASVGHNNNFSMSNDLSFTAGSSNEALKTIGGEQVSVDLSEAYSSSHSTLNTSQFAHTDSTGVEINVEAEAFITPYSPYAYQFTPLLLGASAPAEVADVRNVGVCPTNNINCSSIHKIEATCQSTGPLIAAFAADLVISETGWWGANYSNSYDLALVNPQRWDFVDTGDVDSKEQGYRCRGAAPNKKCADISAPSPAPANPSKPTDTEVSNIWANTFYSLRGLQVTVDSILGSQRTAAKVDDTVFLNLRVFNFSLVDPTKNLPTGTRAYARFYRQKVEPTTTSNGTVVGLKSYVGAPEVVGDTNGNDFVSFAPPTSLNSNDENFVNVSTSYFVDDTQSDTYWIFWVTVWLEDAEGNVLDEIDGHGLATNNDDGDGVPIPLVLFDPDIHYSTIADVPLQLTADGKSYSNNVGMFKQVFYIADNSDETLATANFETTPGTGARFGLRPSAGELSIVDLHTEPAFPRLHSPVTIAADVFSDERETAGVNVMFSEQNFSSPDFASSGFVFEVEHLPHIRKDSSHFVRTSSFRPDTCGRKEIFVNAVARDRQVAAETSFIVPCEPIPSKLKGKAKNLGSKHSKLHIEAKFAGGIGVDLDGVDVTVESLLDEQNRSGELVKRLKKADEPIVLSPVSKRKYWHGNYYKNWKNDKNKHEWSDDGHFARNLKVSVSEHKDHIMLDISGKVGPIKQPKACMEGASQARLLTSLLFDDGSDTPARLDFEALWDCSRKHDQLRLR